MFAVSLKDGSVGLAWSTSATSSSLPPKLKHYTLPETRLKYKETSSWSAIAHHQAKFKSDPKNGTECSDSCRIEFESKDMNIKVFWPEDAAIDSGSFAYGWKLSDDWYVVAGIASSSVSIS